VTILVLDDEPTLVDMLRSVLEREGHRVVGATRYSADLLAIDWDAALLDVTVSGEDGRVVAARLEANGLPRTRVALMTGMPDPDGAHRVFRKPFAFRDLLAWIKELEEA
jgi:DNA-binding response OmpR family regulator